MVDLSKRGVREAKGYLKRSQARPGRSSLLYINSAVLDGEGRGEGEEGRGEGRRDLHIQADLHNLVGQGVEDGQAEGRAGRRGRVSGAARAGAAARHVMPGHGHRPGRLHQSGEVLAERERSVGVRRGRRGGH